MRLYETTFITDSGLPEAEIESEIKKVEDQITAAGGELVETQRWGVRRMAYEIKKRRQGYYAHFLYKAPMSLPAQIDSAFRVNERIMRHLTVQSQVDLEERARLIAEGRYGQTETPSFELPTEAPRRRDRNVEGD